MTVTHRSLSIATEGSFGSLNASGIPAPDGLSWLSLPCERDPIVLAGDPTFNERLEARDGSHALPPEPDTMWDGNGVRIHRRTGTVQVRIDFTTLGTGGDSDYDLTGIGQLLNSGFKSWKPALSGGQSVTFSANNKFDSATVSPALKAGALLGYRNAGGVAEYTSVTASDVGLNHTSSISPKLTIGNGATATLYPMQTWFAGVGLESGEVNSSVAFRVDGQGFRTYAFGCKLQSLSISVEGGRVMGDFTYLSAFITDDHDGSYYGEAFTGPVEPQPLNGASQHFRGTHVVLSATPVQYSRANITGLYGEMLNRKEFKTEGFTLTITNTLSPLAHSSSILTMSDMEVTNIDVECTVTLTDPDTSIADDFRDRVVRQLMIGTGPVKDGCGMAIYLPSAFLNSDPRKYEVNGEITKQTLTYKASRCGSDIKVGDDTPANSFIRLALGL
jgi:hypothetical protein